MIFYILFWTKKLELGSVKRLYNMLLMRLSIRSTKFKRANWLTTWLGRNISLMQCYLLKCFHRAWCERSKSGSNGKLKFWIIMNGNKKGFKLKVKKNEINLESRCKRAPRSMLAMLWSNRQIKKMFRIILNFQTET